MTTKTKDKPGKGGGGHDKAVRGRTDTPPDSPRAVFERHAKEVEDELGIESELESDVRSAEVALGLNGGDPEDDEGEDSDKHHNKGPKFDAKMLNEALDAIDKARAQQDRLKEEFVKACAPYRDIEKKAKQGLKESNFPAQQVNGLLKKRRLLQQAGAIDKHWDDEGKENYRALEQCLSDTGDDLFSVALRARRAERTPEPDHFEAPKSYDQRPH